MVKRRVRGTTSDDVDAGRRRWRASSANDWWSPSASYGGAVWCRHLSTRTASLNLMRSGTFSQCNCVKSGVCGHTSMWKTQAEQQNSTPTASACWDGMEIQPALHYQPLQNEGRNQWLKNGARNWATNTPKLTQNRKTGSYCLCNVRPHWHISVHVDAEVADSGNWHDLIGTHPNGWHWWRRRLDVDQRTSVFAVFSSSRLEHIHQATSSMQVEIMFWSSSLADGRQSP